MFWTVMYAAAIISFAVFFLLGLIGFSQVVKGNSRRP